MEILAGLAVASGLEQVAPRLLDLPNQPDYFLRTAGLALGFGLAYIAMMYIAQNELHPLLVFYDLLGTVLVFFTFLFAHDLVRFLLVLTAICWLVVLYGLTSLWLRIPDYEAFDRLYPEWKLSNAAGLIWYRNVVNAFLHRFVRAGVVTYLAYYWYRNGVSDDDWPVWTLRILMVFLLTTWIFIGHAMYGAGPEPISETRVQEMINDSTKVLHDRLKLLESGQITTHEAIENLRKDLNSA